MSSSPHTDRLTHVAIACVALAGCMKIYPDPELPDVEAEWYVEDCRDGTEIVSLSLVGIDNAAFRTDLDVPCSDTKAAFADVARERYRLEASLNSTAGEAFGRHIEELDLRDGLDKRTSLYFGGFNNVSVAWAFDMGASCASLGADSIWFDFSSSQFPEPARLQTLCGRSPFFASVPDGLYTVVARAVSNMTTVAVSPASAELAVSFDTFTDFGTLVLTPCGSSCP